MMAKVTNDAEQVEQLEEQVTQADQVNEAALNSDIKTIEEWKEILQVNETEYAGVVRYFDWAEGLEMTEADFKAALAEWLDGPIHGQK